METSQNPSERLSRSMQQIRANIEYSFQLIHKLPISPKNQQHIIEKDLRKLQNTIKNDYKSLGDYFKTLESNPPKSNPMTGKELERRRNQINELANLIKGLEQKINKNQIEDSPEKVPESPRPNTEAEDRKKSNKQLFEEQKNELKNQEAHIDNLLDSVTNIKTIGININNELDEEKGLLSELEGHVEKNTKKLLDNNKKLEAVLEKVSNQCLICTIIFEIIIIVFLVMIF